MSRPRLPEGAVKPGTLERRARRARRASQEAGAVYLLDRVRVPADFDDLLRHTGDLSRLSEDDPEAVKAALEKLLQRLWTKWTNGNSDVW